MSTSGNRHDLLTAQGQLHHVTLGGFGCAEVMLRIERGAGRGQLVGLRQTQGHLPQCMLGQRFGQHLEVHPILAGCISELALTEKFFYDATDFLLPTLMKSGTRVGNGRAALFNAASNRALGKFCGILRIGLPDASEACASAVKGCARFANLRDGLRFANAALRR